MRSKQARRFIYAVPLAWVCAGTLAVAILTVGCNAPAPDKTRTVEAIPGDPFGEPAPRGRDADDAARFLAGMPAKGGSPFRELESQEGWQTHRRELDSAWSKSEAQSLRPMREFNKTDLTAASRGEPVTFYPFSGPDALTITVFFPRSPTYLMVGLEPAGTLPTPKQFSDERLPAYLTEVRSTIYSELHRSFFITREMDRQFRGQVNDGLMPAILHLLVRSGHTILGYRYVRLDENGRIIGRAASYRAPGKIGNKGVQIDFRTDADQSVHKLFYFSVNLSDKSLAKNQPFLTFLGKLERVTTFFKATSYMPHQPGFTIIRDQTLDRSAAILQDDSGIPYRFFTEGPWRVQLYGEYQRPYGSFRWLEQADLKQAYGAQSTRPLTFRIGYGFGRVPSNLLLAVRRDATRAQ